MASCHQQIQAGHSQVRPGQSLQHTGDPQVVPRYWGDEGGSNRRERKRKNVIKPRGVINRVDGFAVGPSAGRRSWTHAAPGSSLG